MPPMMTRRRFLTRSAQAAAVSASLAALPAWMPRLAFAQPYNNPAGDVLVSVFLRGGADSLNMVVPHGESAYYSARPQLAIARPDASAEGRALDLDGFFGLHPALAPLLPLFQAGQLRAVHAVGMPHHNRSHFEAMDFMERGAIDDYSVTSGWIGRHLATLGNGNPSPVRGVGWGTALPMSLMGAPSTIAMQSIVDYHLGGDANLAATLMQSLAGLYRLETDGIQTAAADTQAALDIIANVGYERYQPQNGATYPERNEFALALRQTAALIRAQVGLEVASIDLGGWDTHANQGNAEGQQANLMAQLAAGLAAFQQDMGADMARVTVVIMSEFGRRVQENASRGTDHGTGGAMWLMSANLAAPSPVVARWPGLTPEALDEGDLAITIDYRDVLSEVLAKRLKNSAASSIFNGYQASDLGLFHA